MEGFINTILEPKEGQLVMLRMSCKFGFTDTWWRVFFCDNDGTFIGELERYDRMEFTKYNKGDHIRLPLNKVQNIWEKGQNFCYSDNVTICNCPGLCRNK